MSNFTEINYQGSLRGTDYMWGVHAEGCADIEKEVKRVFHVSLDSAKRDYILTTHRGITSLRQLLDTIVDGETRDMGWGDENVKVHNCVAKALRGQRIINAINEPENAAKLSSAITSLVQEVVKSKRHILTAEERARGGQKARSK